VAKDGLRTERPKEGKRMEALALALILALLNIRDLIAKL
jgi:hypothetical protein